MILELVSIVPVSKSLIRLTTLSEATTAGAQVPLQTKAMDGAALQLRTMATSTIGKWAALGPPTDRFGLTTSGHCLEEEWKIWSEPFKGYNF